MQRILIVRLSALGDLVFAMTLLQGLKKAWPQVEVDWLVQPEFAGFLKTQPAIAQVQTWPRKDWGQLFRSFHWLALLQAILRFSRGLKAREYDLVIDAQGLAKSRLLAWLAGGKRRVGYASKEPLGFLLHELVLRPEVQRPYEQKLISSEHRAMIAQLTGVEGPAPMLERPAAGETLSAVIALAPFTTRPQKHWPEAHWASLIQQLAATGELMVMLGGPADGEAAARILALAGQPAALTNWVGKTNLAQAAAQIADAKALIGVDTGLTHMGIAFARPTVAIFGSTVPYRSGGVGPMTVLWLGLSCSPCQRKPTCGGAFTCLADLKPALVLASLKALIP